MGTGGRFRFCGDRWTRRVRRQCRPCTCRRTQSRRRLLPGYGRGTACRRRRHDAARSPCCLLLLQHEVAVPRTRYPEWSRRNAPESSSFRWLYDCLRAGNAGERLSSQPGESRLQGRIYPPNPAEVALETNHCRPASSQSAMKPHVERAFIPFVVMRCHHLDATGLWP